MESPIGCAISNRVASITKFAISISRPSEKYLRSGGRRATAKTALWFSRTEKSSHRQHVEAATVSLTRGQVNAVRAAFKAGIKPSLIARQFGISQSDVKKVLASESRTRS
jgi:hypothetical protein